MTAVFATPLPWEKKQALPAALSAISAMSEVQVYTVRFTLYSVYSEIAQGQVYTVCFTLYSVQFNDRGPNGH